MDQSYQALFESFVPQTVDNLRREFPNGIQHRLFADDDTICKPRQLHPAFFGSYDWHSAVHSHWQVVRAIRFCPDAAFVPDALVALDRNLTEGHLAGEMAYLEQRPNFEMPYGMAWLLQLCTELRTWDHPKSQRWLAALRPLESHAVDRFRAYTTKMDYPVRTGLHNQSAFALGLACDWARSVGEGELASQIDVRARTYFGQDVNAPLAYEPSGTDFLSPALAEADLMRRVLPQNEFVDWLDQFLGQNGANRLQNTLKPVDIGDYADGQLVHFAGLNMSRAWMLAAIGSALPADLPLRHTVLSLAQQHQERGISSALHADYMVSHWAPTFVVYLLTERWRD